MPPIRRSSAVIEGVEATERQLLAKLGIHGVKPIDTADGKFDPNLHQAIAEVPGEGKAGGLDRQCGADRLHDRRPAAAPRHGDGGAQGRQQWRRGRRVGGYDGVVASAQP